MEHKIGEYLKNNELQIEKMIRDYQPYIQKIIENNSKGLLKQEEKEEIISDVFLTIWHNKEKIDKEKILSPYIGGITKNTVNYALRKQHKQMRTIELEEAEIKGIEQIEELLEKHEIEKAIEEELKDLKEIEYQIFTKFYYSNKSTKQIAKELGIENHTVKTRLHRIRTKLRGRLEKRNIYYRIGIIAFITLFLSSITIGAVIIYQKNLFGENESEGVAVAIQNGYLQKEEPNYITSENTSVFIEYFLMDDTSLYFVLNIKSKDIPYIANTKIRLSDLIITDENGNLIFCDLDNYDGYEQYCKEHQLDYDDFMSNVSGKSFENNILEHGEDYTRLAYTIQSENNPKSKKLFFNFSKIEINNTSYEDGDFTKLNTKQNILQGKWNIELEVPKDFYNRETIQYIMESSNNPAVQLEYAYVTQTSMKIRFSYQGKKSAEMNDEELSMSLANAMTNFLESDIEKNYPYLLDEKGRKFIPQRRSDNDGGYIHNLKTQVHTCYDTFPLTVYEATDKVTAYFQIEGTVIELKLKKVGSDKY